MRAKPISFLVALALLPAPAAQAFPAPVRPGTVNALMDCGDGDGDRLYNAQSRDAPAVVAASFAGQGAKLAFRTCRDADRNTHYFIREHRPNRNGVCRSIEREAYPGSGADMLFVTQLYDSAAPNHSFMLKGWTATPPPRWDALGYRGTSLEYGFTTAGDCPPGDDPRYMPLVNVTDGVLKSFEQAWRRVAASPESLQAAVAKLPAQAALTPRFDTPERVERFRSRIVPAVFRQGAHLTRLSCDSSGCVSGFGSHFEVRFDVAPDGIAFTSLHAVWRG